MSAPKNTSKNKLIAQFMTVVKGDHTLSKLPEKKQRKVAEAMTGLAQALAASRSKVALQAAFSQIQDALHAVRAKEVAIEARIYSMQVERDEWLRNHPGGHNFI